MTSNVSTLSVCDTDSDSDSSVTDTVIVILIIWYIMYTVIVTVLLFVKGVEGIFAQGVFSRTSFVFCSSS